MLDRGQIFLPIITDDNGDISIFASVEQARLDLERVDVEDGVYDVFDGIGNVLDASVDSNGVIYFCSRHPVDFQPEELRKRLRRFISTIGPGKLRITNLDRAQLDDLVPKLTAFLSRPTRN